MIDPWSKEAIYDALSRKKTFEEEIETSKDSLKRVLNVFDLTALGVGSTLGCGVYVLAGSVAKSVTGPAVVVSFVVAAIVSSFSGVCYAEFAGRVPKAGSAYIYSYVSVGEFVAFFIGWSLFIEHSIGVASVAKAMTNYLDSLLGDPQKTYMQKRLPMHMKYLGDYPDIAAFLFVFSVSLVVAWGVRKSSNLNKVFTTLNLLTISTVVVSGFFFGKLSNWSIPKSKIPPGINGGEGGFSPFGWTGIVAGAAKCFYGFVGFDSIATTGEETKNPKRTIPIAIVLSLFIITIAYCSIASVMTLMWPYYDQDPDAPFPLIYENLGLPIIKYIVTCGAVFALFTTLIGNLFPIPRILYAMSSDGLLFEFLSTINANTQTPLIATLISGFCAGIISMIFNLQQLVDMTAIGTLVTYLIVCLCILVLRYKNNYSINSLEYDNSNVFNKWYNASKSKITNSDTQYVSRVLLSIYTCIAFVFCASLANIDCYEGTYKLPLAILSVISFIMLLIIVLMLHKLPQAIENLSFKVPFVPFVPCLSIVFNLYLMLELNIITWIRFGLGIMSGLSIYIFYGIRRSSEGLRQKEIKYEDNKKKSKCSS